MKRRSVLAMLGILATASAPSVLAPGDTAQAWGGVAISRDFLPAAKPGNSAAAFEATQVVAPLVEEHPDEWGGFFMDGNVLVVKVVGRSLAEAAALLRARGVVDGVRLEAASVSVQQLQEATDRAFAAGGDSDELVSAGPDYTSSSIVLGLASDGSEAKTVLGEVRSAVDVPVKTFIEQGSPSSSASRYYDTAPFRGGAFIWMTDSRSDKRGCSSGFSWRASGGEFFVTAGHCFSATSDYRGVARAISAGPSGPSGDERAEIGRILWSSTNRQGTISTDGDRRRGDLALVKLSRSGDRTQARVYTGRYNTTASKSVRRLVVLAQNWRGNNFYTSGASSYIGSGSGEITPDWISLVNQTIRYTNSNPNQVMKNLSVAEDASECVSSGDSGGAFYLRVNDNVSDAVGIISGTNSQGGGATNCRSYFTPVGFTSDYGGSLETS